MGHDWFTIWRKMWGFANVHITQHRKVVLFHVSVLVFHEMVETDKMPHLRKNVL